MATYQLYVGQPNVVMTGNPSNLQILRNKVNELTKELDAEKLKNSLGGSTVDLTKITNLTNRIALLEQIITDNSDNEAELVRKVDELTNGII